jgi:tetratricopeptide (TPR) repeat protein
MEANVFTDKSIERYAGRFVWLSINTEDSKNAAFLKKHAIPALPTLLVLSPSGNQVFMRYIGGATSTQLAKLLDGVSNKIPPGVDGIFRSADKLASAGEHAKAANQYASALKAAPPNWSRLGPASESFLFSLNSAREFERCSSEALVLYRQLRHSLSGANVATAGLDCASSLDEKNPRRAELIGGLEKITREALGDPKIELAGDDRSGMYMSLIRGLEILKDDAGVRTLRGEWVNFLEKAAAEVKTPEQRAVYDAHRLAAYLDLKTPEKAIPMLEQSERDFPDDYNPPARLAAAYMAMKENEKALAASERALARAYGPRKLSIYNRRADIYVALADKNSAKKTLEEALQYARKLPPVQVKKETIAALEKRLSELSAP